MPVCVIDIDENYSVISEGKWATLIGPNGATNYIPYTVEITYNYGSGFEYTHRRSGMDAAEMINASFAHSRHIINVVKVSN